MVAVKRLPRAAIWAVRLIGLGAAVLSLGACGDLDNFTTAKDLRVLAVKAEPAGFLVPLDHPETIPATQATVTALVVDPKGQGATLTFSGAACPDYIDTITAASGKGSTLCPGPEVTGMLPPPLDTALATTDLPQASVMPTETGGIQYEPTVMFGLTPERLALFFSPEPNLPPAVAQTVQYNRDFGMDAIVNVNFTLGDETASMLKRVVYWPLLPDDLLPVGDEAQKPDCPATQVANQNPVITGIDFFARRVEGEPMEPYAGTPTLSLAAKDKLFVQPVYDPASVEHYLLRVQDFEANTVVTRCRHELITFQFFATAGTFGPEQRATELPIVLTPEDGKVHIDSEWGPPKVENLPADGKVTVWVVARDERAGAAWTSRTFNVTP
jgi:hypothetical protein